MVKDKQPVNLKSPKSLNNGDN